MKYILLCVVFFLVSCTPDIEGCMDSSACNYNGLATINIDSCTYPENAYDCNGDPSDFRAQYLGLWSFDVDWFMAGLQIGGSMEDSYSYTDSIIATDVQNQLGIAYNDLAEEYYLFVDSSGNLTGDVDTANLVDLYSYYYTIEFEGYFIDSNNLYMYREWSYSQGWGYSQYTGTKIY